MHHELKWKINPRKVEAGPRADTWNAFGVVGVCRIFPIPKASG